QPSPPPSSSFPPLSLAPLGRPMIPSPNASSRRRRDLQPEPTQDSEDRDPPSEKMPSHSAEHAAQTLIPGRTFAETTCSLLLMCSAMLLLHALPRLLGDFIVGTIAPLGAVFCYHWLAVHSYKLSKKCNLVFDEANLLNLTKNFEYELGFIDDCVTPAAGVDVKIEIPKPRTLWEALFFDDRAYKMEEFYRHIYGGEYERAMRREAEERARRALDSTKTPCIPSQVSTMTPSDASSMMTPALSVVKEEKKEEK
ncbi:hypothetical protein PRIPAC_94449, partial [Pristionchus pacificus]